VESLEHLLVDAESFVGLFESFGGALHRVDGLGGIAKLMGLHAWSAVDVHLPEPGGHGPGGILVGGHQIGVVDQSKVIVEVKRGGLVVVAVGQLDVTSTVVGLTGGTDRVIVHSGAASVGTGQFPLVDQSAGFPHHLGQEHGRLGFVGDLGLGQLGDEGVVLILGWSRVAFGAGSDGILELVKSDQRIYSIEEKLVHQVKFKFPPKTYQH